ncbi:hypothetical protein [Streptococcus hyointestinalis]|uniref:hypothetical protein n=1 Tax=Streptococcus hyointestinalis TaxID=1337 RepID=UPI0013DFEB26|nr:hypothetical protein [Streptococcus hyointestinalis]
MRRKKVRSAKLEIGKRMPPLYHKLPNQIYDAQNSEVLKWIAEQPQLLEWTFAQLKTAGYVEYNSETGVWSGIEDWE